MNSAITTLTRNFVNLLYPLHCAICKKGLDPLNNLHLCYFCISEIKKNPQPHCRKCGRSLGDDTVCPECRKMKFYFEIARSACSYEGTTKKLIHLFKYKRKVFLANILSKFMTDFIKENPKILDGIDTITFVPLTGRRLREREFNQSMVLAKILSREFGLPLREALVKTNSTKPQNELTRAERLINLKGVFKVKFGSRIKNSGMLLIDDVMTTGATLSECSKTLLDGGASKVNCLTLARGI